MSLLSQTARYLLMTAFLLTLVGSVGFYTLIHRKIRHEVDEILMSQVRQTEQRIKQRPFAMGQSVDWDNNPQIEPVTGSELVRPKFSTIPLPDSLDDNALKPVRQLRTLVSANGKMYLVTARQPYDEFNELARELSIGVIVGFLLLMGLSVLVGLSLARRLWRPFYATIDQLGGVRLDAGTESTFPVSGIREFKLLNQSLGDLTQKLRRQFSVQKEFTENASHELQTPLAIASAELDLLIQSSHLTETDYTHLQRATDALSRMSQLNRSLLLLTQVENNQFAEAIDLDLSALLNQYVNEYEPFFQHKNLTIERTIEPGVHQQMNRQLAGILLTNLLKNATRHGSAGGCVCTLLTTNELIVSNSGKPLPFPESQLFNRFVKDPARHDSTGLGLALMKQIADRYGLPLSYRYEADRQLHTFRIGLSKQRP